MSRPRRDLTGTDRGSVLPLVLVMVVIGSLVVLPLLDYAITVFRANRVVSERTAQSEAAKAGLRVALADPKNVFLTCDGGGNLTPSPNPTINGISVQTSCTELAEIGPTLALGFEVPVGAAAMQLGATVPVAMSGVTASSAAVPPYPATPDWWATPAYTVGGPGDPAQYAPYAEDSKIWMPDLPRVPPAVRSVTPFDMPAGFDCKVFFPGRYADPIDLTGRIYFASGVYYFEEPVTVGPGADVVVGYGLEDFGASSDCADDLQVAANVLTPPTTFDINGGGATFVFGGNGRLIVDNTSGPGAGPRIRFNQRYADADRGGRISIMSVNGDDVVDDPHEVTNVNSIPRSEILRIDGDGNEIRTPIAASSYVPSSSTFTDKARLPAQLPSVNTEGFQKAGAAVDRGVVKVTWDELTGQDAGGALLGEEDGSGGWTTSPYRVQYRVQSPTGPWSDVCPANELVITPKAIPTDGNEISCAVDGLDIGTEYRFRVRAVNEVGDAPWRGANVTPENSSPVVSEPDAPSNVIAVAGASDDIAQISWDTPASDGGVPITGYQVDAYQVALLSQPNAAPIAPTTMEHVDVEQPLPLTPDNSATAHIRAYDPNGDDLTLTIDTTSLAAACPILFPDCLTAVVDDVEDTITFTASFAAPLGIGVYGVPYTVTDPSGESATGFMRLDVVPLGGILAHPPEADPVELHADIGVPITTRLPVADPEGLPFAPVPVTVDTTGLDADWTVTVNGIDVTITTVAPDGLYSIPYTFIDSQGNPITSTIDVLIAALDVQPVGTSCTVATDPVYAIPTACEMSLPDLTPGTPTSGNQGYRFDVVAINEVGASPPGSNAAPLPLAFDGGGVGLLGVPVRQVVPWVPEPIVDIRAAGAEPVEVAIAGYLAVPMGRVGVDNPNGFDVRISGGVMTGTFDIDDSRATAAPESLPIGFKNNIVLQRRLRIVSVAGTVRSTAIVEVNEDGAGYAVNSWVVG